MYSHNPEFKQSKDNFDEMSQLIEANLNDLKFRYASNFSKLDKCESKIEKKTLIQKLDSLNNLMQVIKDYKLCAINLMEQYYFLFSNECTNKEDWKKKYYKLKKYASDNGVDTTLIEWL